ncbi:MAG: hypothetical protein SAJ12_03785 [Jaaginema sp. PMC 1079.18]|nr:hypothetical protein [Jaaginema sp. PMC 1080.18]MEC4850110.1 hypothetical protein [Jaaginema sp. PMC 1079.18]MEC4864802.1 hypothetical protein [Jaaginema sp. PMC 1078.18]
MNNEFNQAMQLTTEQEFFLLTCERGIHDVPREKLEAQLLEVIRLLSIYQNLAKYHAKVIAKSGNV